METKFITEKSLFKKVNLIHLKLLSFTKKEMEKMKRNTIYSFSYSTMKEYGKQQIKNCKLENKGDEKVTNNVRKIDDTFISGDDEEEEVENSSDISVEEEIIL